MAVDRSPKLKRMRRNLGLAGPIVTLSVGVLLPVLLSTAAGIVAIFIGRSSDTLIFGILVVSFMAAAIGGAIIVYVLLGRRARLARLQSDLLANVTHELRTPLAAIRIYVETLQSGVLQSDPPRAAEALHTIARETEWLEAMIDRVLAWRAAAKDRDLLELRAAPLQPTLAEAVERFRRMVPSDEIDLSVDLQPAGPVVHDAHSIGQAVLNLLINAYKYTSPLRRISLELREESRMAVISVTDNGIGIPEAELTRIFEPFHRSAAAASQAAGAGLGLAIVRHVMKAHGGKIQVESEEGRGSRFCLRLPLAEPDSGETPEPPDDV